MMSGKVGQAWALFLWLLLPGVGFASVLESVTVESASPRAVSLSFHFSGAAPEPRIFELADPPRFVVDFADTALGPALSTPAPAGLLRALLGAEDGSRSRFVLTVGAAAELMTTRVGRTVSLTLQNPGSAAPVPAAEGARIEAVNFSATPEGVGELRILLSKPVAVPAVTENAGGLQLRFPGVQVAQGFLGRSEVPPGTPLGAYRLEAARGATVLSISTREAVAYALSKDGPALTLSLRGRGESAPPRYAGQRLSLNFQDVEVRAVLQLLADFAGLNLLASNAVGGSLTLNLRDVPWDQALDLVLRTQGLGKRLEGNVLLVAPAEALAAQEQAAMAARTRQEGLAPLETAFLQVRYARAADLVALFQAGAGAGDGASLVSERGSVLVDERTNAIIASDTAPRLARLKTLLDQLDIPVRQVLIEARIVTANTNFTNELGIRWGGSFARERDGKVLRIDGSADGAGAAVSLPLSSPTTAFTLGLSGNNDLLDLELAALASEGEAEVVARPKVLTADKQKATVASGVEIPYQQAASSGATAVQFKEAALSLSVTPQITPDDRIIMALQVNQDTVGEVFNGIPSINTNQIETQVLVNNGETLVLGGIFQTTRQRTEDQTPLLGDVPVLGRLFQRRQSADRKQELLIFITPRIVDGEGDGADAGAR
jgi:type IV pilus assembly protein PilQ